MSRRVAQYLTSQIQNHLNPRTMVFADPQFHSSHSISAIQSRLLFLCDLLWWRTIKKSRRFFSQIQDVCLFVVSHSSKFDWVYIHKLKVEITRNLLVCSRCSALTHSLLLVLCTTGFACLLSFVHLLPRSLTKSLLSRWERGICLCMHWMHPFI